MTAKRIYLVQPINPNTDNITTFTADTNDMDFSNPVAVMIGKGENCHYVPWHNILSILTYEPENED